MHTIIHPRESPAGRVQCNRTIPEDGIRECLVEIDGVPLAETIRQIQRLRDKFMESMRGEARFGDSEEIRVDSFFDHTRSRDRIRHNDIFDLCAVFEWRV